MDQIRDENKNPYTIIDNSFLNLDMDGLDAYAKLTYIILKQYAFNQDKVFPSLNTLAKKVGVSRTTIIKKLDFLESKGFISREQRKENGEYKSTLYIIKDIRGVVKEMNNLVQEMDNPCSAGEQPVVQEVDNLVKEVNKNNTNLITLNINNTNLRTKENKKEKISKKQYAEFVNMTEDEYKKLTDKYGTENTDRMIETLDNYKGANGKKYKDDYRAILNWVVDRVMKENGGYGGYGQNRRSDEKANRIDRFKNPYGQKTYTGEDLRELIVNKHDRASGT